MGGYRTFSWPTGTPQGSGAVWQGAAAVISDVRMTQAVGSESGGSVARKCLLSRRLRHAVNIGNAIPGIVGKIGKMAGRDCDALNPLLQIKLEKMMHHGCYKERNVLGS